MLNPKSTGTLIHGIAASEHLDSSGERLNIQGLDISSLATTGVFNYEHKSDTPSQVVGKILSAKKIFDEKDCENDAQAYFWAKSQAPFVYVMGELFDAVGHDGAKEVAAMVRYDSNARQDNHKNKNVINFSIEGSKLEKQGQEITKAIARKVTIAVFPCNRQAVAEEYKALPQKKKDSLLSADFLKSESSVQILEKDAKVYQMPAMKVAAPKMPAAGPSAGPSAATPKMPSASAPASMLPKSNTMTSPAKSAIKAPKGWSGQHTKSDAGMSAVHLNHPQHGAVSIVQSDKGYEVKHNGGLANMGGKKAVFSGAKEAVAHAHNYIGALDSGKIAAKPMVNMPSAASEGKKFGKTLTAGGDPVSDSKKALEASQATLVKTSENNNRSDLDALSSALTSVAKDRGFSQGDKAYWNCSDFSRAAHKIAKELQIPSQVWHSTVQFDHDCGEHKAGDQAGHEFLKLGDTYHDYTLTQATTNEHWPYISNKPSKKHVGAKAHHDQDYYDKDGSDFWVKKIKEKLKPQLNKALTAGSGNVMPSALSGGAVLSKENLEGASKMWPKYDRALKMIQKSIPSLNKTEAEHLTQFIAFRTMNKAEQYLAKMNDEDNIVHHMLGVNQKLTSDKSTHMHPKHGPVKSIQVYDTRQGPAHTLEIMDGEHKGKWTSALDSELQPVSEVAKAESLEKGKNAKEQRKAIFGTDPNAPRTSEKRMKMMQRIKEYTQAKYGMNMTTASGKRDASGKLKEEKGIEQSPYDVFTPEGVEKEKRLGEKLKLQGKKRLDPKPDWRSGDLETQPSPDAAIHELSHLDVAPEGMDPKTYQDFMNRRWGESQKQFGHMQQKKTAGEIQPMSIENPIRREMGLPANRTTRPVTENERALDYEGDRFVEGKNPKTGEPMFLDRQSRLQTPETKERREQISEGSLKFHPERGWYKDASPNALINLRARGQAEEAKSRAKQAFAPKNKKLAASEDSQKKPSDSTLGESQDAPKLTPDQQRRENTRNVWAKRKESWDKFKKENPAYVQQKNAEKALMARLKKRFKKSEPECKPTHEGTKMEPLKKPNKSDKIPGGLADKKTPAQFDPQSLKEGIAVEMEHTSDPKIAREITMDHLTEDRHYYKKLKTIEKK